MIKEIITGLSLSASVFALAQTGGLATHPCGTTEETHSFEQGLSASDQQRLLNSRQELESFTQSFIQNNPQAATNEDRSVSFVIPVVFHVLHSNGSENISDDQIYDQMNLLNLHYQKLNADTIDVVAPFNNLVADLQVEFRLATLDPQGNCTRGITRTFTNAAVNPNATESDRINAVITEHGIWPGNKYLNVYVTAQIGNGAAGYTYKPDNVHGSNMNNGIHILHNYIGSIGTSSDYTSRALTHEIGHWLNLDHTWGGTNSPGDLSNCSSDDGVTDTPPTIGWTSCDLTGTTCGTDLDNVQNYMEYSYCSRMFTLGQKARMHAALNSSVGGRSNIWSNANLNATGVASAPSLCKADFEADRTQVCAGEVVNFSDLSFSNPTGWQWTFSGGNPATSTAQNPSVSYALSGWYEVSLTATDANNSDAEVKTAFIHVLAPEVYPFSESFEWMNELDSNRWMVLNADENDGFEIETQIGYTGNYCVRLNNFNQNGSYVDELVSTTMDLSALNSSSVISFTCRIANAKRTSGDLERLRIFFSDDCGATWDLKKTLFGSALATTTSTTTWEPSSQSDWKSVYIENIAASYFVEGFRIKIEFESDAGNNLFIDDINLFNGTSSDDPVGLEENVLNLNVWLQPNPSKEGISIHFQQEAEEQLELVLYNALGEKLDQKTRQAGEAEVSFNQNALKPGIYFVKVMSSSGSYKLLKAVIQS